MEAIAKEKIGQIVDQQPDDSSYDEIMRELIFNQMIEQGLANSRHGKVTSHESMKKEIESWSK